MFWIIRNNNESINEDIILTMTEILEFALSLIQYNLKNRLENIPDAWVADELYVKVREIENKYCHLYMTKQPTFLHNK